MSRKLKKRDFDFTQNQTKQRWTKHTIKQIITSLRQFAKEKKSNTFTQREYDAWPRRLLCTRQISVTFGSWIEAMERAGLRSKSGITKDYFEMAELFMDCWEENQSIPSKDVFEKYLKKNGSKYTIHMYTNHFGGIRRLAQRIVEFHNDEISEIQLIEKHLSSRTVKRAISPSLRNDVMSRDNFSCVYCGKTASDGVTLEIDHIIPVAKNGITDIENLQTLCFDCNRGKRDKM